MHHALSLLLPDGSITEGALTDEGGHPELRFAAPPGLYQLSIIADGSRFDQEELYFKLDLFGNQGVRSGPWDFDLRNGNVPLVPAYWVSLDGRRLGLWYFQRISLDDLAHHRFRGRLACWLREGGEHRLSFEPYREMAIDWHDVRLEVDPEDHLEALPEGLRSASDRCSLTPWRETEFWLEQKRRLAGTHRHFEPHLRRAVERVAKAESLGLGDLHLLVLGERLLDGELAVERAIGVIDRAIGLPAWGNPREDGYGHNGDMGAMGMLLGGARALHLFGEELGKERRDKLLAKLAWQGDRFLEQALLSRDYWGGSVLQDHGWKSHWGFGTAALLLYGLIPEAAEWLRYALPRVRRALGAIPRDGAIPASSYRMPYLYLDLVAHHRDALRAQGGGDLYADAPLAETVDYMVDMYDEVAGVLVTGELSDRVAPTGGFLYLEHMADSYGDGRAAWLSRQFLAHCPESFYHGTQMAAFFNELPWAFVAHRAGTEAEAPERPTSRLRYYPDTAMVHHVRGDLSFTVDAGPWCGYHAYHATTGPCDRMTVSPAVGHFSILRHGEPVLASPDHGYAMRAAVRNSVLIDGVGRKGDIGYPMSLPSAPDFGDHFSDVRQVGEDSWIVRLDLQRAYPEELGVAAFSREFHLLPDRILLHDHLVLDAPRQIAWHFHTKQELGLRLTGTTGHFGGERGVTLTPTRSSTPLQAEQRETAVVWSYASASGFKPFVHIRYTPLEAVARVDVVFTLLTTEAEHV